MRLELGRVLSRPGSMTSESFEEDVKLWGDKDKEDKEEWVHVRGEVSAYHCGRYVVVKGSVHGALTLECSRCLGFFEQPVDTVFDAQCETSYFKALGEGSDFPVEVEAEDDISIVFDASSANVTELVRQSLILNIPMRSLCRQDCKGLCPQCGVNLNLQTCTCRPPADPRWAKLAELL